MRASADNTPHSPSPAPKSSSPHHHSNSHAPAPTDNPQSLPTWRIESVRPQTSPLPDQIRPQNPKPSSNSPNASPKTPLHPPTRPDASPAAIFSLSPPPVPSD